eukprot:gnl/TRDRNA2_/TRDRNA2_87665_c0_seq1.p2 gnl/TRDRNA2_/TRDRNA2_87665_c0~~gnl/TRDRNA2_/TRDRNA2_87665_c0_seq1.p2  ORF type:complete len:129 (-),score=35.39 gnl/TRDRNA2_/TRDRNA2_87665_c0_seq1:69-455(-)
MGKCDEGNSGTMAAYAASAAGYDYGKNCFGAHVECETCKKKVCLYHREWNNSSAKGVIGGHICKGGPKGANPNAGNAAIKQMCTDAGEKKPTDAKINHIKKLAAAKDWKTMEEKYGAGVVKEVKRHLE